MKKQILFFHQVGIRGGAGTMLCNIINALDKKRFKVIVVCPQGEIIQDLEASGASVRIAPRPLYQFQHMSGCEKKIFHPRFLYGAIMQWQDRNFWMNFIKKCGVDIVHLNSVTLAPMAWSARAAGAKVICLVQETAVHGLFGLRNAWLRHSLPNYLDLLVYISEYDRRAWKIHAPHIEVVPNWVDFNKFDKSISQSQSRGIMGLPQDGQIILFMGGVDKIKGTLPLLQALALLSDVENLLLIIAGYNKGLDMFNLSALQRMHIGTRRLLGMDYHRQVFDFVNRHALKKRVRFVGMTENVVPLYAAADVIVFPAISPHQARPVLEAGAMGKPVVVSDFKNLAEFVQNEHTGLTVPPGDAEALANALRRILGDSNLAEQLGDGNFKLAHEKHNHIINAVKLADVYGQLANKKENN